MVASKLDHFSVSEMRELCGIKRLVDQEDLDLFHSETIRYYFHVGSGDLLYSIVFDLVLNEVFMFLFQDAQSAINDLTGESMLLVICINSLNLKILSIAFQLRLRRTLELMLMF